MPCRSDSKATATARTGAEQSHKGFHQKEGGEQGVPCLSFKFFFRVQDLSLCGCAGSEALAGRTFSKIMQKS